MLPLLALLLLLFVAACDEGFEWDLPPGFPPPPVPADNPMTTEKVELGRHLFYDARLSSDGSRACASCHQQALAFTDGRALPDVSHPRSAMSLVNVGYATTLDWANPALVTLEDHAREAMIGDVPLGRDPELLARLHAHAPYRDLFREAFPDAADPITLDHVVKALAAFERTILSARSPYDRYVAGDASALDDAARRGLALFTSERLECFHCHGGPLFTESFDHLGQAMPGPSFHNIALYNIAGTGAYPPDNTGLEAFTARPDDMGRFKPPTLRNVALTAPYMHDGSIATLEEVIDHYARGGRKIAEGPFAGEGALSPYRSDLVRGFLLQADEKADLLAFLHALTDPTLVSDARLAPPE